MYYSTRSSIDSIGKFIVAVVLQDTIYVSCDFSNQCQV